MLVGMGKARSEFLFVPSTVVVTLEPLLIIFFLNKICLPCPILILGTRPRLEGKSLLQTQFKFKLERRFHTKNCNTCLLPSL